MEASEFLDAYERSYGLKAGAKPGEKPVRLEYKAHGFTSTYDMLSAIPQLTVESSGSRLYIMPGDNNKRQRGGESRSGRSDRDRDRDRDTKRLRPSAPPGPRGGDSRGSRSDRDRGSGRDDRRRERR
jgi:hypothetical protein